MTPRAGECFFNGRIPAKLVLDMVYNPLETLLLRKAKTAAEVRAASSGGAYTPKKG